MAEVEVDGNIFPSEPTPTPNSSGTKNNSPESATNEKVSMPADGIYYDTKSDMRGIALVFNHRKFQYSKNERKGTEEDKRAIVQTLHDLKFDVRVFDDLTVISLRSVLNEVAGEDHSKNDCLMVVVMSHGEQGKIYAHETVYKEEELWENFASDKCPSLIGKPKLFFIQACRGNKFDDGVTYPKSCGGYEMVGKTEISTPSKFSLPKLPDLLIVFSTFEGSGSWFIQSLCKELKESNETDSLQEIILRMTRRVAYEYESFKPGNIMDKKKQIPTTVSTLTKRFYFTRNRFF